MQSLDVDLGRTVQNLFALGMAYLLAVVNSATLVALTPLAVEARRTEEAN